MKLTLLVLLLLLCGCVSTIKKPVEYHYLSDQDEFQKSRQYFYDVINDDSMSIYYENERTGEMIGRSAQICPDIPSGSISFKISTTTINKKIDILYENVRDGDKKFISNKYRSEVEKCLNKNLSKYLDYLNEKK